MIKPPLRADEDHTDLADDLGRPAVDERIVDELLRGRDENEERWADAWADRRQAFSDGSRAVATHPMVPFVGVAVLAVGIFVTIWAVWFRTEMVEMTVTRATWKRSIGVEVFGPVDHKEWHRIPAADDDAYNIERKYEYHYTRTWSEACGIETYTSNGRTQTRTKYCQRSESVYDWRYYYTVDRWHATAPVVVSGDTNNDTYTNPYWPAPDLGPDTDVYGHKRLLATPGGCKVGDRDCEATYRVWLEGHGEADDVKVDGELFDQVTLGGTVEAQVNSRGHVRGFSVPTTIFILPLWMIAILALAGGAFILWFWARALGRRT